MEGEGGEGRDLRGGKEDKITWVQSNGMYAIGVPMTTVWTGVERLKDSVNVLTANLRETWTTSK